MANKLEGLTDIYAYFRRNQTPIYFLSPTPFNLLGLDRWVNGFEYLNFFDSFDSQHPKILVPREHDAIAALAAEPEESRHLVVEAGHRRLIGDEAAQARPAMVDAAHRDRRPAQQPVGDHRDVVVLRLGVAGFGWRRIGG